MKKIIPATLMLPMLLVGADIYMVGDSTMQDYPGSRAPLTGWGTALKKLSKPGIVIRNRALGGQSSRSYRAEKRWDAVLSEAKKGDFVIIQFGHNDGVTGDKNLYRATDAKKTYPLYLRLYIEEARLRGLRPVLLTQTVYCGFDRNGKVYNYKESREVGGAPYVAACRKLAEETGVDFLDINAEAVRRLDAMGKDAAVKLYMTFGPGEFSNYPQGRKDMVHLRGAGADFYAALFVELAKKQNLEVAKLFR